MTGGSGQHVTGTSPSTTPGGGEGNRTPGLNSAIVALCQLSYTPEGVGEDSGIIHAAPARVNRSRRRAIPPRRTLEGRRPAHPHQQRDVAGQRSDAGHAQQGPEAPARRQRDHRRQHDHPAEQHDHLTTTLLSKSVPTCSHRALCEPPRVTRAISARGLPSTSGDRALQHAQLPPEIGDRVARPSIAHRADPWRNKRRDPQRCDENQAQFEDQPASCLSSEDRTQRRAHGGGWSRFGRHTGHGEPLAQAGSSPPAPCLATLRRTEPTLSGVTTAISVGRCRPAGRRRNGRRSFPTTPIRRSPWNDRPTCTCRRW
jgi:hypothetical protein